ncbi:MAG: four helix bundle protein [Chthoniobacterales bacterium]|nr:four helix bundle protein [Chthoniobacterales bacterium]
MTGKKHFMRDHTKLRAFQLADEVAILIYKSTQNFPKEEIYGLTSQIRRAAVSVASNIVEGCTRESQAEYLRYLEIAYGSLKELDYQWSLASRLGYLNESSLEHHSIIEEAKKVLYSLIKSVHLSK